MDKLLVICGPTATGKTSLALHLTKLISGELVSADSRQVYKGMDIGTGKDIPKNFEYRVSDIELEDKRIGYYSDGAQRIWGYDLVEPVAEFSVSGYAKVATAVINDIKARARLPILVGGTGLYIKAVVDGIDTAYVPQDTVLRKKLQAESAADLFAELSKIDPQKASSMNDSDSKNKRRLVRAIEIAVGKSKIKNKKSKIPPQKDVLFIGLKATKRVLDARVEQRVQERLAGGLKDEIKVLLKNGVNWDMQSMASLGYRQWRDFFENGVSIEDVKRNWIKAEQQYVKRQMTWFKRDERINWFDITESDFENEVEKKVARWHNNNSKN